MVASSSASLLLAAAGGGGLLLRQLFDAPTGTFTYLLADVPSSEGLLIDPVFEQHERDLSLIRELGIQLVACRISQPLHHGDRVAFGSRHVEVRSTPGHTDGCVSYVLDDQSMAFTGDALLVRGCGRCDFQQGNAHTLWASITGQLLSLPDSCLLYPGHDYTGRTVTSVVEEKAFNARLGGGATERDFVGHMDNMKLPHPHKIAEALPGNMRSGKPREAATATPSWAPLQRSYAGLPELPPDWVAEHRSGLVILDVRSAEEFEGPDGRIAGSQWIPLPELEARSGEIPTGQPVVVVCHSGSRSALATQQLLKAGRDQVANLRGGLRIWGDEGYPLEGAITPGSLS